MNSTKEASRFSRMLGCEEYYPPAHMPRLTGIEKALEDGCRLQSVRSSLAVRVIRVERDGNLVAYGEALHIDEALLHADQAYREGKSLEDMYGEGKEYRQHDVGPLGATSVIDRWVVMSGKFYAWYEPDHFTFQFATGRFTKTGTAPHFWGAMLVALAAAEREVDGK